MDALEQAMGDDDKELTEDELKALNSLGDVFAEVG
jgi:hypothetical protein